jgi:hypothetical protein
MAVVRAEHLIEQLERLAPGDPLRKLVDEMQAYIERQRVDIERLRVEKAERDAPVWLPLKRAAGVAGVPYETARAWAAAGWIESDKDGGRVIVNVTDLIARCARLTAK